jgi:hypothetical protein
MADLIFGALVLGSLCAGWMAFQLWMKGADAEIGARGGRVIGCAGKKIDDGEGLMRSREADKRQAD